MKLKNKKTGEIEDIEVRLLGTNPDRFVNSLAELNEEWEDVPTEETWYLGEIIGNYSMSKKEAREATEKILAWKRLKEDLSSLSWQAERDGEFTIWGHFKPSGVIKTEVILDNHRDDLNLLFGGEE